MIAYMPDTSTSTDICPYFGTAVYDNGTHMSEYPVITGWGRPAPVVSKATRDFRKAVEYCESIGRSRLLMVAPRPEPIVRRFDVAVRDPLRVHEARCTNRRPRLSLLERVKAELSRRRS